MSNFERLAMDSGLSHRDTGADVERGEEGKAPETKIAKLAEKISSLEGERDAKIAEMWVDFEAYNNLPVKKRKKKIQEAEERDEAPGRCYLECAGAQDIVMVTGGQGYYFKIEALNGTEIRIAESDLLTDMRWGIFYNLNHQIAAKDENKKYNNFRARYIKAYYDKKIAELREKQLIIQRLEIDDVGLRDKLLGEAYREFARREEGERKEKAGFIFEKIVSGILQKISLELGEKYGFEFVEADAIDDVESKADGIMKIKGYHRGAGVEEREGLDRYEKKKGIQLTLVNNGDEKFRVKQRQIESVRKKLKGLKIREANIDDLVLVSIDSGEREVMKSYHVWQMDKNSPGGPEKKFADGKIIMNILRQIFFGTELDFDKREDFEVAVETYFRTNNYQAFK